MKGCVEEIGMWAGLGPVAPLWCEDKADEEEGEVIVRGSVPLRLPVAPRAGAAVAGLA